MIYVNHTLPRAVRIGDWVEEANAVCKDFTLWNQTEQNSMSRLELQLEFTKLPTNIAPSYKEFISLTNGSNAESGVTFEIGEYGSVTFWEISTVVDHHRADDLGIRESGARGIAVGETATGASLVMSLGADEETQFWTYDGKWMPANITPGFIDFFNGLSVRSPVDDDAGRMFTSITSVAMEAFENFDSIRNVFDYYCKFEVDRRWLKQIQMRLHEFETRSEEHINFLGSNLVGVYRPTWLPMDSEEWIEEVLGARDWEGLREAYHDLPDVNPKFEVTGEPINASFSYVLYRINKSTLAERDKEQGLMAVGKLLYYRHLGSVLHNWFKYPAQESIALSLYESLSRKSGLKKHGSWGRLIEYLVGNLVGKDSVHYKTFQTCAPDDMVLYSVSSVKTQVNQLVKELGLEYHRLREEDQRILAEGRFLNGGEGELVLRDTVNDQQAMERAVLEALADPMDFIREELIEMTIKAVTTANDQLLEQALEFMVAHRRDKRRGDSEKAITHMVQFVYGVRRTEGAAAASVVNLTVRVRNLFRSSQLKNPDMIVIRDELSEIVDAALDRRPDSVKASTRIALAVYILLRSLSYQRY